MSSPPTMYEASQPVMKHHKCGAPAHIPTELVGHGATPEAALADLQHEQRAQKEVPVKGTKPRIRRVP